MLGSSGTPGKDFRIQQAEIEILVRPATRDFQIPTKKDIHAEDVGSIAGRLFPGRVRWRNHALHACS